ncbi:MAG: hypothetical protein P8Y80_12885 [Acidobacteriota bacterium]|jgi:hypothetical protein
MSRKKAISFITTLLMLTTSVQAMVIPGRWEKVAAEKPGSKIIVTLMTGDRVECSFGRLSADSLILSTPDGEEREYSKANVARITTADKRTDSLNNGFLIGSAIAGIPSGLIAISCLAAKTCTGSQVGVALPIYVGIGAGIGLAVDASIKDYEILYEAPQN